MNTKDMSAAILPAIGAVIAGGFYAGRIQIDGTTYGLVVAPKEDGEREDVQWSASRKRVDGAGSYNDGQKNTAAMAEAGSELAQWARGLQIGGHADWYIPSQDELEVIYRNLKPTTETNTTYGRSGVNPSAIPPTHAYSAELPAQTAVAAFAEGGGQAFADEWYWTSTQHASDGDYAWDQVFYNGTQGINLKSAELRARAVRRFAI
ncbi:DUF1566 domain-containing protein [Massilia varians]|uniref:Lcl domain-containing protein n=1 Tax=Massilia varians TaxID=457921 RepID=UPI0025541947|nr:DUF1566 domain-containing protein [Massilia varians]MDK6078954.1 DUF1566 domain-containing protein [Massilia varians]